MIEPRFTVLAVSGYPIGPHGGTPHSKQLGLSATVYDRHFLEAVVTLRSEDRDPFPRARGIDRTILAAEEKARELNLWARGAGLGGKLL